MKYCKKCLMPTSRPGIHLDENGVCGGCLGFNEKKEVIDWEQRKAGFERLLNGIS